MSHCVCTCVCACVVSQSPQQEQGTLLPPCDEIQMEIFSGLPALLTIIVPKMFPKYFSSFSRSILCLKIVLCCNGRFSARLCTSWTCATKASSDMYWIQRLFLVIKIIQTLPESTHIKTRNRFCFFPDSPSDVSFAQPQTRSKGSLYIHSLWF